MAEVKISIKDIEDGQVAIDFEFNPPLDQYGDEDELPGSVVAGLALMAECSLNLSDEPEDQ